MLLRPRPGDGQEPPRHGRLSSHRSGAGHRQDGGRGRDRRLQHGQLPHHGVRAQLLRERAQVLRRAQGVPARKADRPADLQRWSVPAFLTPRQVERRRARANDANQFPLALPHDIRTDRGHEGVDRSARHHGRIRDRERQHRWGRGGVSHRRPEAAQGFQGRLQQPHRHGGRLRLHRGQGLQGLQAVPDDDVQLHAFQVPPEPRHHLLQHLPRVHRRDAPLPREARVVPEVLPHLHEVHHGGIRRGRGGRAEAVPGRARSPVQQVGSVLELERRTARGAGRGRAREGGTDQRGGGRRGRVGFHLRQRPVGQGEQLGAVRGALPDGDVDHRRRVARGEDVHESLSHVEGHQRDQHQHDRTGRVETDGGEYTLGQAHALTLQECAHSFLLTQDRPGFNEDGTPVKMTKRKKAALVADKVIVQGVLGNTVGRVGRVAGRLLLGRIPDTAKQGSFQEEKPLDDAAPAEPAATETNSEESAKFIDVVDEEDRAILEEEIFDQVFANGKKAPDNSNSSEEREWKVGESEKAKELSTV
ncbi:hypothetical protein ACHAWF_014670 [Thalassiosira exigua]